MRVTDEEAWKLAIERMQHSGEPVWIRNVENMLQSRSVEETGRWASANMQFASLRSKPWLTLPCHLNGTDVERILTAGDSNGDLRGEYAAAVLARRLQRHSISRWHPDPVQALREAEKDAAA
jgi:hypothetical protein